MLSREWNINVRDLALLHQKSKALLQTLKTHLPDRVGGAKGWNFEKAHSILHKVREIVMWGWAENTSCQGPEHAHIELIKSVAHLTNNKDVFLCILRFHCRCGLIQQYQQILADQLEAADCPTTGTIAVDSLKIQQALEGDRNFSIACELGLRYPTLKAMLNREYLHLRMSVWVWVYTWFIHGLYMVYTMYMLCINTLYVVFDVEIFTIIVLSGQ